MGYSYELQLKLNADERKLVGYTVDSVILPGRVQKQILSERKEYLNFVLNEDIRSLCNKYKTFPEYLFEENLL